MGTPGSVGDRSGTEGQVPELALDGVSSGQELGYLGPVGRLKLVDF